jgi:outer membrane protein OmpA-like peptidoglycan-associated protein
MRRHVPFLFVATVFFLLTPAISSAQQDARGSKDHPLFSRWPGYYIYYYEHKNFDAYGFRLKDRKETVEGELFYLRYWPQDRDNQPSRLEVVRNYENAIRKAGGTVLYTEETYYTTGKLVKEGKEIWVEATNAGSGEIALRVVERQAMEQTIQSNAASWLSDITTTGHAAVYGIYFDVDKAEIKPESEAALAEMAKLLKSSPALKVLIVGHTDNTGTFEHNMKLSQDRAAAVVNALASKQGIAAARLKGVGVGPSAPVASNKAEDGRAKNRRVELVEQ